MSNKAFFRIISQTNFYKYIFLSFHYETRIVHNFIRLKNQYSLKMYQNKKICKVIQVTQKKKASY